MEHDYYDHWDIVGFTREGKEAADGLALLVSDGPGGSKTMFAGNAHKGQTYIDALGNCPGEVVIGVDGTGNFRVEGGSISVWIPKE